MIPSFLTGVLASGSTSVLQPWSGALNVTEQCKQILPTFNRLITLPSPGDILACANAGLFQSTINTTGVSYAQLMELYGARTSRLRRQGDAADKACVLPDGFYDHAADAWAMVRQLQRPVPSIPTAAELYWTGRIDVPTLHKYMIRNGADIVAGNADARLWDEMLKAGWWLPDLRETIALNLRQYVANGADYKLLLQRNRVDPGCLPPLWLEGLRRELAPPSDQITFAVHDVYDQRLVAGLGLDKEFPAPFMEFLRRQGLGWNLAEEPGLKEAMDAFARANPGEPPPVLPPSPAHQYWWSHWRTLAPEQIYELGALFRRGGGRSRIVPNALRTNPGDPDSGLDIGPLLKQADFPPGVRPLVEERAKRRPPREDWVQMLAYGTATKEQVIEGLRDENYDPKSLNQIADMIERKATEQRLKNPIGRTVESILSAYEYGAIDAGTAGELLRPFVHSDTEISWMVQTVDLKLRTRRLRRIVAGLKMRRRLGEYDTREHFDALVAAGVDRARAVALSDEAEWEIHAKYRYVSIHDIRRYLVSGFFSPAEADQRLARLNMTPGDRATLIQEAMARRQRALARQAKADQREAEAAARKAAKAMQEQRARIMRIYTIARLKLFFEDGTMPELEIREVLDFAYQWPVEAQDRLIASWRAPGQAIGVEPP